MITAAGAPPEKGKTSLSCAECRRSKLKCDRAFPCQSCIRRGCAAICPGGTLAATKGNKVLMAHAQKLTEQVKNMADRIRELESALEKTQGASSTRHPLLRDEGLPDPLADISDLEAKYESDFEGGSDNFGSLAVGWSGNTKFYGETAGAEVYDLHMLSDEEIAAKDPGDPKGLGLTVEILELVHSFPFGPYETFHSTALFSPYIPSRERAIQLVDLYYVNLAWIKDPIPRGDFNRVILEPVYQSVDIHACLSTLHAHSVSVFFMVLALGSLFDPYTLAAEQYHALGRAAFVLEPIVRGATCASSQALLLMLHFLYNTDRSGTERAWVLMGVTAKVAQMIGLQRDSAGWNLDREEVQRRRTMFWVFYTWDAWTSIINGRPPALNLGHSDCRFPDDLDPLTKEDGSLELGFHAWNFRYSAACVSIAVQRAFAVQPMDYPSLLHLDKRIRMFPIPSHLQSPGKNVTKSWNKDPSRAMQQYCVLGECEAILLYIHRSYFAQALCESEDPLQHKYSASVVAAYQSSLALIAGLKSLYAVHPKLSSRMWHFWSAFYTACVLLGAIVVESPGSTLAQTALPELDDARLVYQEGSRSCRPPATMIMLDKLHTRAHAAFKEYQNGETPRPLPIDDAPGQLDVGTSMINNSMSAGLHGSIAPPAHAGFVRQISSPAEIELSRSVVAVDPGLHVGVGASDSHWVAPMMPVDANDAYSTYGAYFNPIATSAFGHTPAASQPAYHATQAFEEESLHLPEAFASVQPPGQLQHNFFHWPQPQLPSAAAASSFPPAQNQQEIWYKFIEDLGMSS
ncbi:hypothetical protein FA95DRAFT_1595332 [Auriscalpium vulgare]|uniref:Uncharacterized protein n=1 Tax=Auriscalpium vulgare TaxID=40419 RepID=A0ACB8RWX6_9AGAM|nr:hypothetical protein FA95DRAFT_1595332 [Auriscalpium vulgare]